jgi:Replication initiation and membrane attachment
MKWFRFYNEVYSDPKVQELRPELFRFWVNLLCVVSENEPRGIVPDESKLKRLLGLDRPVIRRYLDALVKAELIDRGRLVDPSTFVARSDDDRLSSSRRCDDDQLSPHRWFERQPESDNAAKRKRDSRERTCGDDKSKRHREMSRDKFVTVPPRVRIDLDRDKEEDLLSESSSKALLPTTTIFELTPDHEAVGQWVVELTSDLSSGRWVDDLGRMGYPADWIRMAIERGVASGNRKRGYIAAILRDWQREGGAPKVPSLGIAGSPRAERPESRMAEQKRKMREYLAEVEARPDDEEIASG